MTDSFIEGVAKAIFEHAYSVFEQPPQWADEPIRTHEIYKNRARAAIEAMREPTEAMCNAYCRLESEEGVMDGLISKDAWQAMIDEVLK